MIKTYQVVDEVGVDINARSELTSKSESRSKLSGDQDGSRVGQVGIKIDIRTEEVQSKLLV